MKLLIAALAAVALSCPARADLTYNLVTTTVSNDNGSIHNPIGVSFTVADAAVDAGSFFLSAPPHAGGDPVAFTGDLPDFRMLNVGIDFVTADHLMGFFSMSFSFDPATRAVTSSLLRFEGTDEGVNVSGTGTAVSGTYGDDPSHCSTINAPMCHIAGYWAAVPEPASISLLSLGLLGVGFRRRYG